MGRKKKRKLQRSNKNNLIRINLKLSFWSRQIFALKLNWITNAMHVFSFSTELWTQMGKDKKKTVEKSISEKPAQDFQFKIIYIQSKRSGASSNNNNTQKRRLNINWHARNKSHVLLEHDENIYVSTLFRSLCLFHPPFWDGFIKRRKMF